MVEIQIEDDSHSGGIVVITLPQKEGEGRCRRSLRIGVAEDELDMREFYEIMIPELGHQLLWSARNGIQLIEMAHRERPDLLIVDIQMPMLDGLDAVRSLTRDEPLPVIVVSGHHDQETMERADEAQLMGYLIKPIREADLKAAINTAAQRFEELRGYREAEAQRSAREAKAKQHVLNAVGVLANSAHITRQQAFHRIQELARKEHRSLAKVSQTIVDSVDGVHTS